MRRLVVLVIVLAGFQPAARAAFAFKQCAVKTTCGGISPCTTAAMGSPLTAGSILLAGGVSNAYPSTLSASGFTDSGAGERTNNGSGGGQLLYEENSATTSGYTLTISDLESDLYSVWVCEYTGQAAASPIDAFCFRASGTSGSGANNTTCGSALSPTGSDLIFAFTFPATGPMVAGSGYTQRAAAGGGQEDEFNVSSSITPQATDQNGAGDAYGMIGVAIKPAGGAAKPCMNLLLHAGC